MEEIWKDIPGYVGKYQVSDQGRVRSLPGGKRKGRVLRPGRSSNGYLTVALYSEGRAISHLVQDLVMSAFVGPKPEGNYTRHLDDVRTHNCLSNLSYGSPGDNYRDVYSLGRTHGKLTRAKVHVIRERLADGVSTHELSREFGVCERAIRNIREGRTFAWLT